ENKSSGTSVKRIRKVVDNVADEEIGKEINYEEVATYCEPNKVRPEGCGKKIKGGKEKALGNSAKGRLCTGCGERGVGHKLRTCPRVVGVSASQP
ncbi:hypothetical protein FRX31_006342, partial [Thalictrum thalictroides]